MSSAVSPITRQTVGKTFIVAISILGVGALAQLGAIGWLFVARFRVAPLSETAVAANTNPPGSAPSRDFADPFADASLPSGTASPAPVPAPALPTPPPAPPRPAPILQPGPNRQIPTTDSVQQDRFNELIDQGRVLRDRGEFYAAVTKFREAQVMDSTNPVALVELAMTYDKMGFGEKATENWKQIYDLGPSVGGIYYEVAKSKLDLAVIQAKQVAGQAEPASIGISPTSKFGFAEITRTPENDPQALQKFVLHVPIRVKPRARIDPKDVLVLVNFFDVVNNNPNLEHTKADTSNRWASPPGDWADEDTETLDVTYTLPRPPQGEPLEDRKFYGYIASVYYKNALQDFKSDPPRLAQKAPPPRSLAQEVAP